MDKGEQGCPGPTRGSVDIECITFARLGASYESYQGRINQCAGCTMGPPPTARGTPDQLRNFFHAGLTVGLNVTTTTKKVVNFLSKKCTP